MNFEFKNEKETISAERESSFYYLFSTTSTVHVLEPVAHFQSL